VRQVRRASRDQLHNGAVKVLSAVGIVLTVALGMTACGSPVKRMSVPQKVDVGTTAYCQTLSGAHSIDPFDSQLVATEKYIITPSSGHNGMGLPIEGTRLEADVQAARSANGNDQAAFLKAIRNVLTDCRYILGHQRKHQP
jgi:hypothetical protein